MAGAGRGRRLRGRAAGAEGAYRLPALTGRHQAIGDDDFRISDMGGLGAGGFDATDPAVIYNPERGEYLVVWSGRDNALGAPAGQQIYAQRLDGEGNEIGVNDRRLTSMGGVGSLNSNGYVPAMAHDLLVWSGTDLNFGLASGESEIFGRKFPESPFFEDGFESGDTNGWSSALP